MEYGSSTLAFSARTKPPDRQWRDSFRSTTYDCVVIGAGVRVPPHNLALFEVVINAVRKVAPGAGIAFNTRAGAVSADAAARGLALGSRAV